MLEFGSAVCRSTITVCTLLVKLPITLISMLTVRSLAVRGWAGCFVLWQFEQQNNAGKHKLDGLPFRSRTQCKAAHYHVQWQSHTSQLLYWITAPRSRAILLLFL